MKNWQISYERIIDGKLHVTTVIESTLPRLDDRVMFTDSDPYIVTSVRRFFSTVADTLNLCKVKLVTYE